MTNYYELGPQNSRGFKALKIWMALRQIGKEGYLQLVGDDIRLARELYEAVGGHPELERYTCGLSIATFRYVPPGARHPAEALNHLNEELLRKLQNEGKVFLSNAVVDGTFLLRACIVNFRTTSKDVRELPGIVVAAGRELARNLGAKIS